MTLPYIASIVWITITTVEEYITIASIITTLSNVTIIVAIFLRMKSALGRFFLSKLASSKGQIIL